MRLIRSNQQRVQTDDGIVWDLMSEIEASGSGYSDLMLGLAQQMDRVILERYMRRIGMPIALLVTTLNELGIPHRSVGVGGRVKSVKLAPYDACSSDIEHDYILINVNAVKEL